MYIIYIYIYHPNPSCWNPPCCFISCYRFWVFLPACLFQQGFLPVKSPPKLWDSKERFSRNRRYVDFLGKIEAVMKFTNSNLRMSENKQFRKRTWKILQISTNISFKSFFLVGSSWNLTGGVHQRKVLSHQIFPVPQVKRKNYQKFHTCWLSVREPMIGFPKKKSNFRTKDANGKNGDVFFKMRSFFLKSTPLQDEEQKNHWNMVAKTIQKKTYWGRQKAHFQELPRKWLGRSNLKRYPII